MLLGIFQNQNIGRNLAYIRTYQRKLDDVSFNRIQHIANIIQKLFHELQSPILSKIENNNTGYFN